MKYFIIAGERSGDLHGGRIVDALRERDTQASFEGWGGGRMAQAGVSLRKHYRDTATMGFQEVLTKLNYFRKLIRECKQHIEAFQPDAVIFIDFGAFNLRVAPFVKELQIPSYYFITPKVWAWNTRRAEKVKRLSDHRLVILPFEADFFNARNISATYVGNPLQERISQYQPDPNFRTQQKLDDRPIMAILPGSRVQEVKRILPAVMMLVEQHPELQWVVSGVRNLPEELYAPAKERNLPIVWEDSYGLMSHSHTAIVASGTATLETALFNVPQIVVYQASAISAAVVRLVIKVPYVSLPNLIAGREIIPELLQKDFNGERLQQEFAHLQTENGRRGQLSGYAEIRETLGNLHTPTEVANYIQRTLPTQKK